MRLSSFAQQQQRSAAGRAAAAAATKGKGSGSKHATAFLLCAFVASGLALPYFLSKSGVGVRISFALQTMR
jgi:hypothetical protein